MNRPRNVKVTGDAIVTEDIILVNDANLINTFVPIGEYSSKIVKNITSKNENVDKNHQ